MSVTTLDSRTALVVVDLQAGIAAFAIAGLDQVVERAAALADAFRTRHLPVILVRVAGGAPGRTEQGGHRGPFSTDFMTLLPALHQQPGDHVVTKRNWGAFTATDLDALLKQEGVTQLVIAGVATSAGVESTARHAHELGYNVTLAVDAMTDRSPEAHTNSIERIFPKLGETGSADAIIALLASAPAV